MGREESENLQSGVYLRNPGPGKASVPRARGHGVTVKAPREKKAGERELWGPPEEPSWPQPLPLPCFQTFLSLHLQGSLRPMALSQEQQDSWEGSRCLKPQVQVRPPQGSIQPTRIYEALNFALLRHPGLSYTAYIPEEKRDHLSF